MFSLVPYSLKIILIKFFNGMWYRFLRISIFEKIILINIIPAFMAIVLPVARFYIFESYFYINNPVAVYLAGIVVIMVSSFYYPGLVKLIVRLSINAYYLFWIIYFPLAGELTKAEPYKICIGYYFNIAVPLIFIIASLFNYLFDYD
jgi:hypothetical protein